jgi:hypothetical protein
MRGFSGIRDQSDVVFKFEPVDEGENVKRMRLVCDKPGPQKKPAPVGIKLSDAGLSAFDDIVGEVTQEARTVPEICTAIELQLQSGPKTWRELKDLFPRGERKFKEALGDLVRDHRVVAGGNRGKDSSGYTLDDEEKRTQRVMALLASTEHFRTAAQLRIAAKVPPDFVESMMRRGVIVGANEGWLRASI